MALPDLLDLRAGGEYRFEAYLNVCLPYTNLYLSGTDLSEASKTYAQVSVGEVFFQIPTNFDPRLVLVDGLRRQERELTAEFQKRLTEIQAQIAQYLAIENGSR